MIRIFFAVILIVSIVGGQQIPLPQPSRRPPLPTIEPKAEERARLQGKVDEIGRMVRELKGKRVKQALVADVEVYAKAGQWLLEFPGGFFDQKDVENAISVMDAGIARGKQLLGGEAPWVAQKGRKVHGYYSALDGSVQPVGVSIPESYDGTKPVRLYVWLHGRNARLTEASFIHNQPNAPRPNSTAYSEDVGQIQIDCYGRGNNANHWAGEVDVFEAIAAVSERYRIDPKRIILRGFSLGGAASWHIALHHPDAFVAAEIGAGTWPRRSLLSAEYPAYLAKPLRIWENIIEWALNSYNLPIVAHDGDNDTQVASIPPPPEGTPTRGQLESSIRVREQLGKEGFVSEGTPNALRPKGTDSLFLISENTGHGVSPAVRKQIDAFLKEWGDRGQRSPDRVRFLTYTTRYNRSYWVSVDGMERHYERAEVDAQRQAGNLRITTKNVTRLGLREAERISSIEIDGERLAVNSSGEVALQREGGKWRVAPGRWRGLHKTHALQGPIDDAFLDPYLLVRPTGTPWNAAVNEAALKRLAAFDRVYARNYRAHPRVKDDREVTAADFDRYHIVLFGDPGSNRWIRKVYEKLPLRWSKSAVTVGSQTFAAGDHLPVMIYPNPLSPGKYVVLNSGLTIDEREYNSDYSMPRLGDYAVLKVADGSVATAGLFDEEWRVQ